MESWGAVNEAAPQVEAGFMLGNPSEDNQSCSGTREEQTGCHTDRLTGFTAAEQERHDL